MVNRVGRWLGDEDVPANYWVVSTEIGNISVSAEEAGGVMRALNRSEESTWVQFEDLFGSSYRVRATCVDAIWESTAEQREKGRRFSRERRAESDRGRRPWEEE